MKGFLKNLPFYFIVLLYCVGMIKVVGFFKDVRSETTITVTETEMVKTNDRAAAITKQYLDQGYDSVYITSCWRRDDIERGYKYRVRAEKITDIKEKTVRRTEK